MTLDTIPVETIVKCNSLKRGVSLLLGDSLEICGASIVILDTVVDDIVKETKAWYPKCGKMYEPSWIAEQMEKAIGGK